ncbi:pentatricopeptide repeat-containing protein, chloroplastic [Cocos nucifera]|uniref:Pentatricopeptide repeat-containing protein, chloroplastic n=1 Tax=Cocos nucifera TaxID=13894 RepID=A0A8K0I2Q8_COCNU|nr:pentatricopeptide repeat-containing protein, chloroplastic [Cocos nucifera]
MSSISPAPSKLQRCSSSSPLPPSDQRALALLLQGPINPTHLPRIHARIFRLGAHQDNLIATRLIGRLPIPLSLRILCLLDKPSIFPFNAAIRVLSDAGLPLPALSLFKSLMLRSVSPNDFTFSFLLKACTSSKDAHHVRQIHTHVIKTGFGSNSFVPSGLLSAYVKGARDVVSADRLFDEMPERKLVCCWTGLIAGYAQSGRSEEALKLFQRMVKENLRPEDDTMVSVLSACSNLNTVDLENWVNILMEFGTSLDNVSCDSVNTVLIYLYGRSGKIEKGKELFDRMMGRGRESVSIVAWNAMIGGYVQNSLPIEALDLFHKMLAISRPKPNHVTIVSVLSACALVGDLELGRWAYEYVKLNGRKGVLESNRILATAFIDMYSKCGSLEEAKKVFNGMTIKDVVSFNAMIMGLATNGQGEEVLRLFSEMEKSGVQPNDGTFLGLLCACAHSGLVDEGQMLFRDMYQKYLVTPNLEHYASFVYLLARASHVEEALEVVKTMPIEPNGLVWGALLGACLVHSRVDVAQDVARKLVDVDPENSAGYVMLSNAYAIHHSWGNIVRLRGLMKVRGIRKQPGNEIDGLLEGKSLLKVGYK